MEKKMEINRREFIKVSSLVSAAAFIPFSNTKAGKKKKNVLFIPVDDLRPELGCYGKDYVISPNIDRLAESGIVFNRAYCQSALCNPSRASLLTGLRPETVGVLDLRTNFRDNLPNAVTLPQYFKNNGYTTLGIGKTFHNTIPDDISWSEPEIHIPGYPFDPDAVYRAKESLEEVEKKKQKIIEAGKQKRAIDRFGEWYIKTYMSENPEVTDNEYYDGAQTDVAIERITKLAKEEKPFFFSIGYYRPHMPFNVPKKYWDLYDREKIPLAENDYVPKNCPVMAINNMAEVRQYTDFKGTPTPLDGKLSEEQARLMKHGYLASVSYIDAQVGRLLDTLDELKIREDTIVVLWGDHGWKLGEHNSYSKMTNFEIDTRAPLIISAPGTIKNNISTEGLVEFVDIYPTVCELAGLPIRQGLEGISAVPLIKNTKRAWKKAVFSQFLETGRWKALDGNEYHGYSIRTDRYRYNEWYNLETKEFAACELYDHKADPGENENIAGYEENKNIVKELSSQLKAGWRSALPD
jgi:arylsulfatase A-like enzyme